MTVAIYIFVEQNEVMIKIHDHNRFQKISDIIFQS